MCGSAICRPFRAGRATSSNGWPAGATRRWPIRRPSSPAEPTATIWARCCAAVSRPGGAERLLLVHDEVVGLEPAARGMAVTLAMGSRFEVDVAALAIGNLPSPPPAGVDLTGLPDGLYAADPWAESTLARLSPSAPVLLLGTGLTMVDIALSLTARGHQGPLFGLSRRGLTPRRHGGLPPAAYE